MYLLLLFCFKMSNVRLFVCSWRNWTMSSRLWFMTRYNFWMVFFFRYVAKLLRKRLNFMFYDVIIIFIKYYGFFLEYVTNFVSFERKRHEGTMKCSNTNLTLNLMVWTRNLCPLFIIILVLWHIFTLFFTQLRNRLLISVSCHDFAIICGTISIKHWYGVFEYIGELRMYKNRQCRIQFETIKLLFSFCLIPI